MITVRRSVLWASESPDFCLAMNSLTLYGDKEAAQRQEKWLVSDHGMKHAYDCVQCGSCEAVCPQHIAISKELQKVSLKLL